LRALNILLAAALLLTIPAYGQERWSVYKNDLYQYGVAHPTAGFTASETGKGLTLAEDGGRGQIDIYGATNPEGLGPAQFKDALAKAERIREITYTRNGRSWLAVSGYYRGDGERGGDLIFYAKFMFSPDRSRLAAFEASYPVSDRQRFDAIVERMEDSLTAPP
jgi:hypothetical protein